MSKIDIINIFTLCFNIIITITNIILYVKDLKKKKDLIKSLKEIEEE